MFLTESALHELTGRQRPSAQIRWLRAHGWPFEINALGRPVVLQAVAVVRLGGTPQNEAPKLRLVNDEAA